MLTFLLKYPAFLFFGPHWLNHTFFSCAFPLNSITPNTWIELLIYRIL